jgi:hypothetical protein
MLNAFLLTAQGPGPGAGKQMRMYDPATETTFKGVIDDVSQVTPDSMKGMQMKGMGRGMTGTHLTVKTGDEVRTVMLGPSTFTESKGFKFAKGDNVEITGSKVTMGGTDYIVAREIAKDGKTLTLRDKTGTPLWSGGMMGRGAAAPPQTLPQTPPQ